MRYLLLLTSDPSRLDDPPQVTPEDQVINDWVEMTRALADAGILVAGEALEGRDVATTVRRRHDQRLVTDGPFAETTELLIGYYLIDVADLDAALAWAARMPNVTWGSVEVRPVRPGPASTEAMG